MYLYLDFPYLEKLEVKVRNRKTIKNKIHIETDKTLFSPNNLNSNPCDIGFFDGIRVNEVYSENGKIFHILESKTKKDRFTQKLNLRHRVDIMQQYSAAILYKMVFKKLFSLSTSSIDIQEEYTSIEIELIDKTVDITKLLTSTMNIVNGFIENGLEIKLIRNKSNYTIKIESLGEAEIKYPVPTNTSELTSTVITSYKLSDNSLQINLLAGKRCLDFLSERYNILRKIRSVLDVDDISTINAVENLIKDNNSLESEILELKSYVYKNYINKVKFPDYQISDYDIVNHRIDDLNISNLNEFASLIPADICIVAKNDGEFSSFCTINKIEEYDLSDVFKKVEEIYPFELNYIDGNYQGKILSQYLDRFLDAFDKYLRENLSHFIENPPIDEQLELETEDDNKES
ncbi:MAG: hypothetical protein Q4P34_06200 [Tissierellia bacterium]|nr:hypothetical protein [Tissierellia bacterium]